MNEAITKHKFLAGYDYVTLLVGIINQYRKIQLEEFEKDYENLLHHAIGFAKENLLVFMYLPYLIGEYTDYKF